MTDLSTSPAGMLKLRHRFTKQECYTSRFNTAGIGEIIVCYEDGGQDSDYASGYDVYLTSGPRAGQWVHLLDARKSNDVITDNYNTMLFEPSTLEDRERGFTVIVGAVG